MKYNNILFDLDGTITEPEKGIINGIIYALNKFGIEVAERSSLHKFIGPPLRISFPEFCGFDEEKTEQAILYYREYYGVNGLVENDVMPGMEDALKRLSNMGARLFVATSKPEEYAKKILQNLNLDGYFEIIAGASFDGSRDTKEAVMEYLMKQANIDFGDKKTVMVGDRHFDINGAKAFGLESIGVLFGYGSREEFEAAGATYIVDTAEDMVDIILN